MPVVQSGGRTGPHGASRAALSPQGREMRAGRERLSGCGIGGAVGQGGAVRARVVEQSGTVRPGVVGQGGAAGKGP